MEEDKVSFKEYLLLIPLGILLGLAISFLFLNYVNYNLKVECEKICTGYYYAEFEDFKQDNMIAEPDCYCKKDGKIFSG